MTVLSQTQYHLGELLRERREWRGQSGLYLVRPILPREKPQLSYSQIVNWQRCRQRWKYCYIDDLVPRGKTIPLMVGDLTHLLREKFLLDKLRGKDLANLLPFVQERFPDEPESVCYEVALQAATLVNGFIQEYQADGSVQIISPEVHLVKDCGDFTMYARIDGMARVTGSKGIWREELKTTSRMNSAYLAGQQKGLQTGIAMWLMKDLMPNETIPGSVFSIIVKTKVPQFKMKPIFIGPTAIEFAKETVYNEFAEMQKGYIYRSSQCQMYNRECGYFTLCKADREGKSTEQIIHSFYTSRSEQKKRTMNQQ